MLNSIKCYKGHLLHVITVLITYIVPAFKKLLRKPFSSYIYFTYAGTGLLTSLQSRCSNIIVQSFQVQAKKTFVTSQAFDFLNVCTSAAYNFQVRTNRCKQ